MLSFHSRFRGMLLSILAVLLASLTILPSVAAQDTTATTTITLAVPEFAASAFTDDLLSRFEAAYPGVEVVIVKPGEAANVPPITLVEPQSFFDAAREYAEVADVLFVDGYSVTPEIARAGYLLDLAPLAQTDSALNPDDFYPAAWESYRWDGGMWAFPMNMLTSIVIYDSAAFDTAGLAYPDASWTMEDFANAAHALTVRDSSGAVITPGLFSYETALLMRSLYNQPFYHDDVLPNAARLNTPELAALLDTWQTLLDEGVANSSDGIFLVEGFASPLVIGPSTQLAFPSQDGRQLAGALLPGDRAGLRANGFAVSGGTRHPEIAYQLAKFLAEQPEVKAYFHFDGYARRDLGQPLSHATPEVQTFIAGAVESAFPVAELRFGDYLTTALIQMRESGVDGMTALAEAEAKAVANLSHAETMRAAGKPVVAAPPVPVAVAEGEIVLKFALSTFNAVLPNQDQWDTAVAEFAASDPLVGHVQVDTLNGFTLDVPLSQAFDCYYLPYVALPSGGEPDILNIDPFLNVDATFSADDALNGVMAQVTLDGRVWALPMTIAPEILLYDRDALTGAGVTLPVPGQGWTVDQFTDALHQIKAATGKPGVRLNASPLMLAAAYGGLPVDYRTVPPTFQFTDSTASDALGQVLRMAGDGLIDYTALGSPSAPPMAMPPIYGLRLEPLSPFFEYSGHIPFRAMSHPRGTQYTPVSYTLGAGYISASTAAPEACYRWLRYLSVHPELLIAMPAYRSLVDSPAVVTVQGQEAADFYQAYAALLDEPQTVVFPSTSSAGTYWQGVYFTDRWMNAAFDNVVLNGADLQTELASLQNMLDEFMACAGGIAETVWQPFADCAKQVDPAFQ